MRRPREALTFNDVADLWRFVSRGTVSAAPPTCRSHDSLRIRRSCRESVYQKRAPQRSRDGRKGDIGSVALAFCAHHRHQRLCWLVSDTGWPSRFTRVPQRSPFDRKHREPISRSGAGGARGQCAIRTSLRHVSWAQCGRHRQYPTAGSGPGAERSRRRSLLVYHQRIRQRRDAVLGFTARRAALAARHLPEDVAWCSQRCTSACRYILDTNLGTAAAGTVH